MIPNITSFRNIERKKGCPFWLKNFSQTCLILTNICITFRFFETSGTKEDSSHVWFGKPIIYCIVFRKNYIWALYSL